MIVLKFESFEDLLTFLLFLPLAKNWAALRVLHYSPDMFELEIQQSTK